MQITIRRRLADRVWQWRKLVYAGSSALVLLVLILVFLTISLPSTLLEVSNEPILFDAARAYRTTQQLAQVERREGERSVGSEGAAAGTRWLTETLDGLRMPYETDEFTTRIGDRDVAMTNIEVRLPGQRSETIVVSTPRDPRLETDLTPDVHASGTAMLLDLAQVFAARPHDKTLVFLFTEGGSYGGLGVERYLEERGQEVRTVLSVQGLGREGRKQVQAGVIGPESATPGWLLRLSGDVLARAGMRLDLPGMGEQVADHALRLHDGEQVPGLRHGKAALFLYDSSEGRVTSSGLATQGSAVERLLLSLDAGLDIPRGAAAALVLPSGRYLTTRALDILAFVMLLPSSIMALTWLAITRLRPEAWLRYLRNFVSFLLPILATLGLAWAAAALGWLPRYQFLASPVDAAAARPHLSAAAVLALTFLAMFLLSRHFLGYLRPREPLVMAEVSKLTVGLAVLVAGLALLMTHSPFSLLTAVTAAWTWPLATCFAETGAWTTPWWLKRRSNALLLLTGLLAPGLLYVYLVVSSPLTWATGWWFLFVQTVSGAYGLRGPIASALITSSFLILLGVKRLHLLPMETLDEQDDLSLVAPPPPRARAVRRPRQRARGG
jgi:hypothetical protein